MSDPMYFKQPKTSSGTQCGSGKYDGSKSLSEILSQPRNHKSNSMLTGIDSERHEDHMTYRVNQLDYHFYCFLEFIFDRYNYSYCYSLQIINYKSFIDINLCSFLYCFLFSLCHYCFSHYQRPSIYFLSLCYQSSIYLLDEI